MKLNPILTTLVDDAGTRVSLDATYVVSLSSHHVQANPHLDLPERFMLNIHLFSPMNVDPHDKMGQRSPVHHCMVYYNAWARDMAFEQVTKAREDAMKYHGFQDS